MPICFPRILKNKSRNNSNYSPNVNLPLLKGTFLEKSLAKTSGSERFVFFIIAEIQIAKSLSKNFGPKAFGMIIISHGKVFGKCLENPFFK